jgi:hypothetical protein
MEFLNGSSPKLNLSFEFFQSRHQKDLESSFFMGDLLYQLCAFAFKIFQAFSHMSCYVNRTRIVHNLVAFQRLDVREGDSLVIYGLL